MLDYAITQNQIEDRVFFQYQEGNTKVHIVAKSSNSSSEHDFEFEAIAYDESNNVIGKGPVKVSITELETKFNDYLPYDSSAKKVYWNNDLMFVYPTANYPNNSFSVLKIEIQSFAKINNNQIQFNVLTHLPIFTGNFEVSHSVNHSLNPIHPTNISRNKMTRVRLTPGLPETPQINFEESGQLSSWNLNLDLTLPVTDRLVIPSLIPSRYQFDFLSFKAKFPTKVKFGSNFSSNTDLNNSHMHDYESSQNPWSQDHQDDGLVYYKSGKFDINPRFFYYDKTPRIINETTSNEPKKILSSQDPFDLKLPLISWVNTFEMMFDWRKLFLKFGLVIEKKTEPL